MAREGDFMSMRTLRLSENWDIDIDGAGRIVVADGVYATAQDVANVIRLFTREAYFDQQRGIPHFDIDLGVKPSPSVVRSRYRRAAMQVTNVANAAVEIEGIDEATREMRGEITLTCADRSTATVEI